MKQSRFFLLMFNMFIAMMGFGLIFPILPDFLKEFNAGGQTAGYLVAAFGLTQFIFSPIAGRMSDKYGRKIMIIVGLLLFAISNFIFALAGHVSLLFISRLIIGIGAAAMIPSMLAYVADITTAENRGKGLSLMAASMSLGFAIGPGFGGFLAEFGLRTPLYVSAVVAAIAVISSMVLLPESLTKEKQLSAKEANRNMESVIIQFGRSIRAPYFILLVLVFSMTFGLANFEAIFPMFVDEKYNYTTREISIMITVGALIGSFIQMTLMGTLFKHFGEKSLINLTLLLSALSLILMLFSGNFYYILVLTVLFFSFTSMMRPAINTLLSKSVGEAEQGFVAGMNNAYMSLGNIFGPAVAGTLYGFSINAPNVFGAAVLVFSLYLSFSGKRSPITISKKLDS